MKRDYAPILAVSALLLTGAGCGSDAGPGQQEVEAAVLLSPENIVVVDSMALSSGPTISGSLQPDRTASIRAEIGGSVLETRAEPGQRVARGTVLARIDDSAIRDAWLSARSGVTTAEQSAEFARRNVERSERLAQAGAIAERELENARVAATSAEALLADARARLAQAEKQLASTTIAAPIGGIISERAAHAGDVVSPGTLLFSVVDPTSMRLEASVPASQLGAIRLGAPVDFEVTGYDSRFSGRIDRVNPTVDPATGQVVISAAIPNTGGQLVGGVFAQGRVGTRSTTALAAPLNAIQESGQVASALRVRGGVVEQVSIQLGIRDEQAEMVEIVAGLSRGDTLLTGAAQGFTPGTPVRVRADRPVGQ